MLFVKINRFVKIQQFCFNSGRVNKKCYHHNRPHIRHYSLPRNLSFSCRCSHWTCRTVPNIRFRLWHPLRRYCILGCSPLSRLQTDGARYSLKHLCCCQQNEDFPGVLWLLASMLYQSQVLGQYQYLIPWSCQRQTSAANGYTHHSSGI